MKTAKEQGLEVALKPPGRPRIDPDEKVKGRKTRVKSRGRAEDLKHLLLIGPGLLNSWLIKCIPSQRGYI